MAAAHLQCMTVHFLLQEPLAICQLYRSLGPAMVARLHGNFAFVVHDSRLVRIAVLAQLSCAAYALLVILVCPSLICVPLSYHWSC